MRTSYSLRWAALVTLPLVLFGCDDSGHVVPFGQESDEPPAPEVMPEPEQTIVRGPSQTIATGSFAEIEGVRFGLDGHRLHAIFPADTDGDGDRDILGLLSSESDDQALEIRLLFGRWDATRVVTQVLATQRLPPCDGAALTADFQGPPDADIYATVNVTCEDARYQVTFVLDSSATPRLRERIAVRDGTVTLSSIDIDEDGHADLRASFALAGTSVVLEWLDRAGGLTRTDHEPSQSIRAAGSEGAVSLVEALCGEHAQVAIGGRWGLECAAEDTRLQRLASIAVVAQTDLLEALATLGPLNEEEEARFVQTLGLQPVRWRPVAHRLPAAAATRHAGLSFDGPRHIVDHAQGLRVSIDDGTSVPWTGPAPIPSPAIPGDPSAVEGISTWAVREVQGRGDAFQIEVVDPAAGVFHAPSARAFPLPAPSGNRWLVLGWAPQGLLLFDGRVRFLLAITSESSELQPIIEGRALPAPLNGARIDRLGERWIAETALGVLVGDADGQMRLWRPLEWSRTAAVLAIALSPSGQQIAVAREDGVFIMEQGLTPQPAPRAIAVDE